jgi:hypothetical protein
MIKPLPRWLQQRYATLWDKLGKKPFDFDTAKKILSDNQGSLNVAFSELRKLGWLKVEFDPNDARKRIYRLEPLEKAFKELAKVKKGGKD